MRVALAMLALSVLSCRASSVGGGPGISGPTIAGTLSVRVIDEATGHPIRGAIVTIPVFVGRFATDASGVATVSALGLSGSPEVVVEAEGYVRERWIGVDRAEVVVTMTTPPMRHALHATVDIGGTDAVVSVTSAFGILRLVGPASAAECPGGVCDVDLDANVGPHDAVVIEHDPSGRAFVARSVALEGSAAFTLSLGETTESDSIVSLAATLPPAGDLVGVVGVPGLSTEHGVALLGVTSSTLAPARLGAFASDDLWFVATAHSADGRGESTVLDRDVPAGSASVDLPPSFLAVPTMEFFRAVRDALVITVDPEADLYVIEFANAGVTVERMLVLHPSRWSGFGLVEGSEARVRAIDTDVGTDGVDLERAASTATRIATRIATLTL